MVIDMRSRTRSAFPRPTRPRTATPPVSGGPGTEATEWSTISCDDCTMEGTAACTDCVVTFLCTGDAIPRSASSAALLEFDGQESDTLRLFQAAGLAPALRHVSRLSQESLQ